MSDLDNYDDILCDCCCCLETCYPYDDLEDDDDAEEGAT